ncbi:methyl-accepting chemotaxis protein, partial [Pseudoalteromonas ruthenica]
KTRADSLKVLHRNRGFSEFNEDIAVAVAIDIPLASTTWSLVIELPKAVVLSNANLLARELEESTDALGRRMMFVGLIIAGIGVFVTVILV